MDNKQNVQIPKALFDKITTFFECANLADYNIPAMLGCKDILLELRKKQNSINLRTAYTNMIYSNGVEEKQIARANYQKFKQQKRYL